MICFARRIQRTLYLIYISVSEHLAVVDPSWQHRGCHLPQQLGRPLSQLTAEARQLCSKWKTTLHRQHQQWSLLALPRLERNKTSVQSALLQTIAWMGFCLLSPHCWVEGRASACTHFGLGIRFGNCWLPLQDASGGFSELPPPCFFLRKSHLSLQTHRCSTLILFSSD